MKASPGTGGAQKCDVMKVMKLYTFSIWRRAVVPWFLNSTLAIVSAWPKKINTIESTVKSCCLLQQPDVFSIVTFRSFHHSWNSATWMTSEEDPCFRFASTQQLTTGQAEALLDPTGCRRVFRFATQGRSGCIFLKAWLWQMEQVQKVPKLHMEFELELLNISSHIFVGLEHPE